MGMLDGVKRFFGAAAEKPAVSGVAAPLREAVGATVDIDDEDGWRKLSGDTRRDLSPLSQARMQETALYLWDANLLANRIVELPLAYLLADGVSLSSKDEEIAGWLKRFWNDPINSMDLKLAKKVRELSLYGEQCWPVFVNEVDGHVRLGYLDPGAIVTVVVDPDNPEQAIGIVTARNGKGVARRYRVIVNGPDEELFTERTRQIRETFSDGECFWFTVNDLSNGRRGRSDLRAPADWVDAYDQFLFGELDRAGFMRAFVWDVELAGADENKVRQRAKEIVPPRPGSVRVHNESEKWTAVTPGLNGADSGEAARLFRNHALGGATIPEHWYGGGGDVNRSTGESMGEPTVKVFTLRQRTLKYILESVGRYVIRQRLLATEGREPAFDDPRLAVEAVFPELTSRDTAKYATALSQAVVAVSLAIDKGLLTPESACALVATLARQFGVDIDPAAELAKVAEARAARAEADVFTGVTV